MTDGEMTALTAVVMVIGLVGTLLPILPGLVVVWAIALLYGFTVGWSGVGIGAMVVLTLIVGVSIVKGFVVPKKAADAYGASGVAQLGALVGGVVGFFVIPVIGLIIGAVVGAMVVELVNYREWQPAWRATKGLLVGFGTSALIDLGLGIVMVSIWAVWAFTVL